MEFIQSFEDLLKTNNWVALLFVILCAILIFVLAKINEVASFWESKDNEDWARTIITSLGILFLVNFFIILELDRISLLLVASFTTSTSLLLMLTFFRLKKRLRYHTYENWQIPEYEDKINPELASQNGLSKKTGFYLLLKNTVLLSTGFFRTNHGRIVATGGSPKNERPVFYFFKDYKFCRKRPLLECEKPLTEISPEIFVDKLMRGEGFTD